VPAITFLIAARNGKGYGPANQVMLLGIFINFIIYLLNFLTIFARTGSSSDISASRVVERGSKTVIASDVSVDSSSRPATPSRSSSEVYPAELLIPPLDVVDSTVPMLVQEDIASSTSPEAVQQLTCSSQMSGTTFSNCFFL